MNHSTYSADRATHLKIVVVALVAHIAIANLGLSSRANSDVTSTRPGNVVKAGKPMAMTGSVALVTRQEPATPDLRNC
jgi:hypothetical protein